VPERQGRLIIICGLPGAGKTTLSIKLAEQLGARRYDPDEWMDCLELDLYDERRRAVIETLQWREARDLIAHGGTAIIVWGTWGRGERALLRQEAKDRGAMAHLIYLDLPLDELFARIAARDQENPPITRAMLEQWAQMIEVPGAAELAAFDPLPPDLIP
jgi:predicted kinase